MFDIYPYLSYFDVISFTFISRNFNGEADNVAKSALSLLVTNSLSECKPFISNACCLIKKKISVLISSTIFIIEFLVQPYG